MKHWKGSFEHITAGTSSGSPSPVVRPGARAAERFSHLARTFQRGLAELAAITGNAWERVVVPRHDVVYVLVVALVVLALRVLVHPWVGPYQTLIAVYPVAIIVALSRGLRPALLGVTITAAVSIVLFNRPELHFHWPTLHELSLLVTTAIVVALAIAVSCSHRRVRLEAQQAEQMATRALEAERCAMVELEAHRMELARSNVDLEAFARVVSHDLKEPLRGMANFSRFVLEDAQARLTAEERDRLTTVIRLGGRMQGMLDALMEYARAGRGQLIVTECSAREVVDEALEMLSARLQAERVDVVIGTLPGIRCDRTLLMQVFANLIANGIKYNDSEPKRIDIGSYDEPDGPVFFVRDNGIGIQPRHHDAIFAPFRRLHSAERYEGGSGCGLSIVKRIIERHEGRIRVTSAGSGTTFLFTLGQQTQKDRDGR